MASAALIAQEDCDVFNIQDLAAEVLTQQAQIDSLSCLAGVEMDGYRYKGVSIGDQCWFAENLRTTVYADDSSIPEVIGSSDWGALSTGARCHYDNNPVVNYGYGLLYNWYAVDNASGLCPNGWHVPTDGEWTALEDYITAQGFNGTEGTALKSTSAWSSGNGTDDFGFSALPGGSRTSYNGPFNVAGLFGSWWSSSPSGGNAWYRYLFDYNPGIYRFYVNPRDGFSVRCLRDAD
ncbi:MAG: fibrobacter succinogenes major paralogous domain-containing protein [Flavobacteriales bacterium]|nr:fibrobacter succinogenes major paralogous domain-containing protein [Flavobacteriales bacterium]